jgi:hypothetical protein
MSACEAAFICIVPDHSDLFSLAHNLRWKFCRANVQKIFLTAKHVTLILAAPASRLFFYMIKRPSSFLKP